MVITEKKIKKGKTGLLLIKKKSVERLEI